MSQKRSLEIEDNEIHCKKIKLDSRKTEETILKCNSCTKFNSPECLEEVPNFVTKYKIGSEFRHEMQSPECLKGVPISVMKYH